MKLFTTNQNLWSRVEDIQSDCHHECRTLPGNTEKNKYLVVIISLTSTLDVFVCFLLARHSQDVFLLTLIPLIEQGGSKLLVILLYDLCDGLTI